MGESIIPESLMAALQPVTIVVGHYGTGKTNFAINLAIDLVRSGKKATLVDLDIVNPYFRASEQRRVLEDEGVRLVAPVFAEAGTSLDVPSLTGLIVPAIEEAGQDSYTILDAGGDDAGATALGRFARPIFAKGYAMLCVLNRYRNLVQDPEDAVQNLREIEVASHLQATALVSNAHMKSETTDAHIEAGLEYAQAVSALTNLPLVAYTMSQRCLAPLTHPAVGGESSAAYCVKTYVRTPWESA